MTSEAFRRGFTALVAAFPNMNFNAGLFWEMLNDLDGQFFLMAVWELIKTVKEVYPGSNIIAMLREKTLSLQSQIHKNNILKIGAETEKERIERWQRESVPMPEECRVALEKLGIKLGGKSEKGNAGG